MQGQLKIGATAMGELELTVDPKFAHRHDFTGIPVRAKSRSGKWINADIAQLDKPSLLAWLRSRGGANEWAEDVVGLLLGHGVLHRKDEQS
jgi:hypothetical protein